MLPLVSIIVPSYQREKLLCETIGYLLAQDYPNRELLIVDQSSNHEPETARYLDSIAGQVRYFHLAQPDLSGGSQLRDPAEQRRDRRFFRRRPGYWNGFDFPAVSAPEVWGATGFVLSPGESDSGKYGPYRRFVSDMTEFREKKRIRIRGFIGCLMSFRRQLFEEIGYFDEWIGTQLMAAGEDFEFCQRAVVRGYGSFPESQDYYSAPRSPRRRLWPPLPSPIEGRTCAAPIEYLFNTEDSSIQWVVGLG